MIVLELVLVPVPVVLLAVERMLVSVLVSTVVQLLVLLPVRNLVLTVESFLV